ncbi:MAG: type VI secretion system contractile sheath small subunit [Betaproteobacteria bacterium]|nr:type VI secretion system contractile sheath small subunit [Betaproteobacteria bacterium]
MSESIQHKLDRVRPPRVQITYDVETGNAIEKKELPLVVGILADLSGKPVNPPPKVRDRRFMQIDRDNFDDILVSIAPRLAIQVDNALQKDGSKLNVELNFKSFEDFSPINIVQQVSPLRRLYEARLRLRDLLTKLDGNDDLDQLLQDIVNNTQELQEIRTVSSSAGAKSGTGAETGAAAEPGNTSPEPA